MLALEISAQQAADYLGIQEPSEFQTRILSRLARLSVDLAAEHLNHDYGADGSPVPAAVEEACYMALAELYEKHPASGSPASEDIRSVKVDDVTVQYKEPSGVGEARQFASGAMSGVNSSLSGPVRALLRPYRRYPEPRIDSGAYPSGGLYPQTDPEGAVHVRNPGDA